MCPHCRSQILKIKQRKGLESWKVLLTGKRKYCCRDCGMVFRAIDRRAVPRDSEQPMIPLPRRAG